MKYQTGWRWCSKCQGMHFGGPRIMSPNPGVCPAGGKHEVNGSGNYALLHNETQAPGQAGWKWCPKCQGLHFLGEHGGVFGRCPAYGNFHVADGSGDYRVRQEAGAPGQHGWRFCRNCSGLNFVGGGSAGVCPAGGMHDNSLSGNYAVATVGDRFRFSLESFDILNTRSRHEDTVFVSVALAVGNRPPVSVSRSMGNLNNGHFAVNAYLDALLYEGDVAVLTYAIVNNGHSPPGEVETKLQQTVTSLAQQGAQAAATAVGAAIGAAVGASIGTAIVPILGTALGALAGWLVSSAAGLLFADCDGPVAAGFIVLNASDIRGTLAYGTPLRATDDHPGTDSPHGCGSNSEYKTTWSVTAL